MRSFEELIKQIKLNKEIASRDIGEVDPRKVRGMLGKIKRAKENLKELQLEYRNHVRENLFFLIVNGKESKSFCDIASSETFGCFSTQAEEFYEEIASKIDKRHYDNQSSSPALFDMLMSVFSDLCGEIGIIGYPALIFDKKYSRRLTSKEDLVKLVQESFDEIIGKELVGLYLTDKVATKAMVDGFEGKKIPILININKKELSLGLDSALKNITPNVFGITVKGEQDEEKVKKELIKIKKLIK